MNKGKRERKVTQYASPSAPFRLMICVILEGKIRQIIA